MANFVTQCFEKLSKNIGSYPHVIILFKIVQEQLHHFKDENFEISEIIINDILRNVKDLPERVCQRLELLTELFKILGINLSFE
jgi:archaellum component FlaC